MKKTTNTIHIEGARVHNLKNINLDIPVGEWRYFKDNEISELSKILSKSTGVHGK